TIAIVARADGTIVGGGRAGCSDIYNAKDEETALGELTSAVAVALDAASASASDLRASAFSLAGADWPEDIEFLNTAVREFGFGRQTLVVNDAIGALRAGTPDGVGVGVTCGTGIAIGALNAEGKIWYSGHWPVAAGGAEMGWQALSAVYAAHLGLGRPTALTEGVLEFFGAESVEAVLHKTTHRGANWGAQQRARLARILLDKAGLNDDVALEITGQVAARHADAALAAAGAVGLRQCHFRLVLNGGVLRHPSGLLEHLICERVAELAPAVELVHDPPESVVGAVLLAFDLAGCSRDRSRLDRLLATLPGRELFATS
ncbi:MAG TPA: BadF/BadG/BcrA/BcrD ATPase family protein, partial [Herpetosiphonaceae bacterium]|nr:BadF/BadG/BcrA/BcrD ATPase family protein [Herpetosiphonaceae bacterium]